MNKAVCVVEQLIDSAKSEVRACYSAGRLAVVCFYEDGEVWWKVAGKIASRDMAQRVIAKHLGEQERESP